MIKTENKLLFMPEYFRKNLPTKKLSELKTGDFFILANEISACNPLIGKVIDILPYTEDTYVHISYVNSATLLSEKSTYTRRGDDLVHKVNLTIAIDSVDVSEREKPSFYEKFTGRVANETSI